MLFYTYIYIYLYLLEGGEEDVLTSLVKSRNLSRRHVGARTQAPAGHARSSCRISFDPVVRVDVDFVDCFSRVDTCCVIVAQCAKVSPSSVGSEGEK